MEKDIDKIPKNPDTDIIIRIDDFGGKRGITIREFVKSERYTGFTKAGTRIPADKFSIFKAAINSIDEKELLEEAIAQTPAESSIPKKKIKASEQKEVSSKKTAQKQEDFSSDENAI